MKKQLIESKVTKAKHLFKRYQDASEDLNFKIKAAYGGQNTRVASFSVVGTLELKSSSMSQYQATQFARWILEVAEDREEL